MRNTLNRISTGPSFSKKGVEHEDEGRGRLPILLKFEMRDGKPVLVKLPAVELIDDHEGKPVGIQSHIGRRPIAAFGNSDGDLQMLQWTTVGSGRGRLA